MGINLLSTLFHSSLLLGYAYTTAYCELEMELATPITPQLPTNCTTNACEYSIAPTKSHPIAQNQPCAWWRQAYQQRENNKPAGKQLTGVILAATSLTALKSTSPTKRYLVETKEKHKFATVGGGVGSSV